MRELRTAGERGVTLIEITIMMLASSILIFAAMPTMTAVVRNAKNAAALTFENNVLTAVLALQDDMQIKFFTYDGSSNNGRVVYLMVTDGDTPREVSDAGTMSEWQQAVDNSTTTRYDFLERHFVTNNPPGGSYNVLGNPEAPARGWRGPYLNPPLNEDPWGNRYAINSQWFPPSEDNDVVILSAGQNEIIETVYAGNPVTAGGDDIIVQLE